jgi:DNA-binding NtrC family response regulator
MYNYINKKHKIFIVDDNSFCRSIYKQHLINIGFSNVHTFENGEQCLESIEMKPDIILIDFDMTPTNGLDILRKIRGENPFVHMVMISAQDDIQVAVDAMKSGAEDYIIKNELELENITSTIDRILNAKVKKTVGNMY